MSTTSPYSLSRGYGAASKTVMVASLVGNNNQSHVKFQYLQFWLIRRCRADVRESEIGGRKFSEEEKESLSDGAPKEGFILSQSECLSPESNK